MYRLVIAKEITDGIATGVQVDGKLEHVACQGAACQSSQAQRETSCERVTAALIGHTSQLLHVQRPCTSSACHMIPAAEMFVAIMDMTARQPKFVTKSLSSQARSAEVVSLSREAAELMERLEAAEAAADRYEAKYRAAKGELQQSQALNAQHTAELEQLSESLSNEQAAAQSSQQAVEELTTRLNMIQVSRKPVLYSLKCSVLII